MKANHNMVAGTADPNDVVVNISKSKNESKSQLIGVIALYVLCCGKYQ